MPITALPAPPLRTDPTNFSARGDALLGALPTFVTEANALQADVNNKQQSAILQASNAALSATNSAGSATNAAASAASVAAPLWVSGTTYAANDVRCSPVNGFPYRRLTAGAGTVDPSTDAANWSATIQLIATGGTGASTAAAARANLGMGNVDNTSDANKPLSTVASNSLGMRNRIINGDMRIDQRNAGAAVITGAVITYVTDRFVGENFTSTGTVTLQQSSLGLSKSARVTATAAVTDLTGTKYVYGLNHAIEAQNIYDLNGKSSAISFRIETNWSGNLPVCLRNSNSTRSFVVDVPVVSGVNAVNVTIPLESASVLTNGNNVGLQLTIGFNNESTFRTTTTGAWVTGNLLVSTLSTQWAKTTGNFINVTDVQLEQGSVATPFERRPIGLELALCQRYFQNGYTGNLYLGVYWGSTNTFYGQTLTYPVGLRVNPSIVAVAAGSSGNYWTDPATSTYSADTALGVTAFGSANAFRIQQTRTAGGATPVSGSGFFFESGFNYSASAEL